MRKKIISLLLVAAMAFSLTGCGGSSEKAAESSETKTTEAEATAGQEEASGGAAEGKQKLTVWCWDSFNVDAMKKAGEIYSKDHPDVVIDVVETPSSDIQTLLQTYLASDSLDELPDIFLMDDQVFAKYLQNYPELFADLTDSGINFADFAPSKAANSVADGKNYGVPYDSNTVVACYAYIFVEN